MRRALLIAVLTGWALSATAQDVTARAQAGYQLWDFGTSSRAGLRQTYDFGVQRSVTANSRLSFCVRVDDFRGTSETGFLSLREESGSRQLQPVGEFVITAETLRLALRTDFLRDDTFTGDVESTRDTERTSANLMWAPLGLPTVQLVAHRNVIREGDLPGETADENVFGTIQYPWRNLSVSAQGRHLRASDANLGYSRTQDSFGVQLGYTGSALDGKLLTTADITGERANISERATGDGEALVPVPVRSRAAYHAIDDTPLDQRDHALAPIPALRDGNIDANTEVAIGPQSTSFQNLAIEFSRSERVEEVRIVVRDAAGNPLRNGGGVVAWDAYVSEDGVAWAPVPGSASRFDVPTSAYTVSFDEVTTRWVKVVSFGVHSETVFVTEVEAFDLSPIVGGPARRGRQDLTAAAVSVGYTPTRRLSFTYTGSYSALEQSYDGRTPGETSGISHVAAADFELIPHLRLQTSATRTDARASQFGSEGANNVSASIQWTPNPRLRVSLDSSRQSQAVLGLRSTIETRAIRLYGSPVRALTVSLDAGLQTQTLPGAQSAPGERLFLNFTTTGRVTRTVRIALHASLQRARSEADPTTVLLGVPRDDRYAAEITWQPGRPLIVSTRLGWSTNNERQGLTQRYRAEWQPFSGGAVSFIGSYDEDVDPITDRRSRRLVFTPRWTVSRYIVFDLNYTAVDSSVERRSDQQKSLYATVTVTK